MSAVPTIDSFLTLGADVPQDSFRSWARSVENNLHPALAYANLAVNGFHQVSQENGDTAVGSGAYPSDQFISSTAGGIVATFKRVATPFASRLDIPRGIEIEVTTGAALTSGHMLAVSQRIEGERLRGRLLWGSAIAKPLSVGFVVRSTVSGRAYISVANSGGARARPQAFDLVANTDTWVPLTFPGDTSGTWPVDTGVGLIVRFCFAAGSAFQGTASAWQSANVFGASDITNFGATTGTKIWVGPVVVMAGLELPTFAEVMACQRHLDDETLTCRRYWQTLVVGTFHGRWTSSTAATVFGQFQVPMRAPPTSTLITGALKILEPAVAFRDISSIALSSLSDNGGYFDFVTSTSNSGAPAALLDGAINVSARM